MDVLGEPQRAYPSIHITGTNGKTTTARMIEALLGAFELRTGRYTRPHVQSITERISLDGAPISAERFIETYQDIKPYVEMVDAQQEYRLSFFEVLTGMAYAAFADAPVDVAVVEVGMGGTWDATNVIDARRRRRHPDRPGPHRPARRHARRDRRREGRDHQAGRDGDPGAAAGGRRAGDAEEGRRGGRHGRPRGHGVRRRLPARWRSAASC